MCIPHEKIIYTLLTYLSSCFYRINYESIVDQAPKDACYPQASIRKRLGQQEDVVFEKV